MRRRTTLVGALGVATPLLLAATAPSSPAPATAAPVPVAPAPVAPAPAPAQPSVTLPPELARILRDYEQAWQARDSKALAALFAEDGFVMMSGSPPVRGRAAIERIYAGMGGPLALRAIHYRVEGSVGFILGAFAGRPGDPDSGKFTLTIVKGAAGHWLIQSDMDNSNGRPGSGGAPPPAAPAGSGAASAAPAGGGTAGAPAGGTAPAAGGLGAAAAQALLDRAIEAAGGRRALQASPAFRWNGTAMVHAGGRDIAIAGRWRLVPPHQARVETWERLRGPDSTRALILDGDAGWTVRDGRAEAMAAEFRAHETAQFHLYALMRLVTLRGPGCRVTLLPDDATGREGVRAACAGFPDADLYFDPTARLVRMITRLTDPATGREVTETADLDGTVESRGVRWPRTIRLAWDGAPYFDLEILEFEALKSLDPATFAPPR